MIRRLAARAIATAGALLIYELGRRAATTPIVLELPATQPDWWPPAPSLRPVPDDELAAARRRVDEDGHGRRR